MNALEIKQRIKQLLKLLNNKHADIIEVNKSQNIKINEIKKKYFPSSKIKNHILFLKIPSFSSQFKELDQKLINICSKNSNKYNAIILDIRNNGGGSSKIAHTFASIFFNKPVIYGKFIKKDNNKNLKSSLAIIMPNKKIFIDKPIAILISKKCFSAAELFLAPFKVLKRAILIGENTSGGSASPISRTINILGKKFIIKIPTWRFFLKGKNKPLEKTKISPDIFYKGKDIEKIAEKYLQFLCTNRLFV